MAKPFVLGIAGPTGSGKSTLVYALQDAFPGRFTVLHLDDYFKPEAELPRRVGRPNWDEPDAIRIDRLIGDIQALLQHRAVTVHTKDAWLNPQFQRTGQGLDVVCEPRQILIVEGFLALWFPALRRLFDLSIYLAVPYDVAVARRWHPASELYKTTLLREGYETYVAPSAKYADAVIDAGRCSPAAVLDQVVTLLPPTGDR